MKKHFRYWPFVAFMVWTLCLTTTRAAQDPQAPVAGSESTATAVDEHNPQADPDTAPKWFESLAAGTAEAQRASKPMLLYAKTRTCPHCVRLVVEMQNPLVQQEFQRWILVSIDVDASPDDARLMGVTAVPALRVLTPAGRILDRRDGYMSADELRGWLSQTNEDAAWVPPAVLLNAEVPDALGITELIKEFARREPIRREAAVQRLLPHQSIAAVQVSTAFSEGTLSTRLAALELLSAWKAPLDGLDPWQPASFTTERLQALSTWAVKTPAAGDDAASEEDTELTPEELTRCRELLADMLAANDEESAAIRERLARFGRALLPEVAAAIEQANSDDERARLTALRYRLASSVNTVLSAPGLLERLASADLTTRQQAVDELAARATAEDEQLLLELFSDPAPLIRELSLRTLQKVGRSSANSALLRLLDDPEPNVRAAVLKQIAESPNAALVPKIAEYVTGEKDPDLIVHAVRFFKAARGEQSLAALEPLLKHSSWQVRAESAEAIGKIAGSDHSIDNSRKADAYLALLDVLNDEDTFVVSRAVNGLTEADLVVAVEPLVKAAESRPELAADVVKVLTSRRNNGVTSQAVAHLRRFCTHADPRLRAAGLSGLAAAVPQTTVKEVELLIADETPSVRLAATKALYALLEDRIKRRSSFLSLSAASDSADAEDAGEMSTTANGFEIKSLVPSGLSNLFERVLQPGPSGDAPKTEESVTAGDSSKEPAESPDVEADPYELRRARAIAAIDNRLEDIRQGRQYEAEIYALAGRLESMLSTDVKEERLAAAQCLAALGRDAIAVPALHQILQTWPDTAFPISHSLAWLRWEDSNALAERLIALVPERASFLMNFLREPDPRAEERMWSLLPNDLSDESDGIAYSHIVERYYGLRDQALGRRLRKAILSTIAERSRAGAPLQRQVALRVLTAHDEELAIEAARTAYADEAADDALRAFALRLLLLQLPEKQGQESALEALRSSNPVSQKVALQLLAFGRYGLFQSPDERYTLLANKQFSAHDDLSVPELPVNLTTTDLIPLQSSADAEAVALTGYLLALLDYPGGREAVLDYWRSQKRDDPKWSQLASAVIAASNNPGDVPLLEEIYAQWDHEDYEHLLEIRKFYWTIRQMTGPEILKLRKQIRDEVGMGNLR